MRSRALVGVIALMLVNAPAVHAQKKDADKFRLSGRIVDKTTGAPVQTAVVRFGDLQRAAIADSTGRFVLDRVPQGTHYMEVARLGYESTMDFVRIVADDDTLLIELVPQPLVLEGITALSNRLERRRNHATTIVRAFDAGRLASASDDLKHFLSSYGGPITTCPIGRNRNTIENDCIIARGEYYPLRVYLNEMPLLGAPLDLYFPGEFELVEYYPSRGVVRLYTTAFLERVAKGKAHIDPF
jgi:hypothetical protein